MAKPEYSCTNKWDIQYICHKNKIIVTVTKVLILCLLLADRGHITKQVSLFPDICTQRRTRMPSVSCKMSLSITAALGLLATCSMHMVQQQRKLCQHVRGMTRSLHDEAYNVDCAGISVTAVCKSKMYSSMCPRSDLWTSSLYWILSATGNLCNSWRVGGTRSHSLRSRTVYVPQHGLTEMAPV